MRRLRPKCTRISVMAGTGRGGLAETRRRLTGCLARGPLARSAGGYPGACQRCCVLSLRRCTREEDWYIAQCLEVDVASQGHTIDEALANLAEAVELYLEEVEEIRPATSLRLRW